MQWDEAVDLLVVGSGAAGLSAAIRAHDLGCEVLIVEASERYGGSTAISGGVVWIPDNPQLPGKGISDSREDALSYLAHITAGEVSTERLAAYVDGSRRVLAYLHEKTHLRLDALEQYCDYYAEFPGAKPGGRSMEPQPFDASQLGEHFGLLRDPHRQSQVLGKFGISARQAHGFVVANWTTRFRLAACMLGYALRWFKRRRFHRDTRLFAGNALIGRLRLSLLERGVPLWLESPATKLIIEDGRVLGAEIVAAGATRRVRARKGVLLAAGGFERSQAMRDQHMRPGTSIDWNAGNPHNLGAGIEMGVAAGGTLELMDEAWWTPVTRVPKSDQAWVLVVEKSLPGAIMVNASGRRFTNEAAPYLDVARAMFDGGAVPDCHLVFDATFRASYPVGPVPPGYAVPDARLPRRLRDRFLIRADTLDELAEKCGVSRQALHQTVTRFNAMARDGIDADFGRGENLSDRYYADPRVTPNPCLRAIETRPYYAIRVYPGDLGTKGGLVTDVSARVLDSDGRPIPGLYAAGNTSASVMGRSYPGAGGTIGPALTFGFLAAEAAAGDAPCQD